MAGEQGELLTIKLRYKQPEGSVSESRTVPVTPVRGSDPAYASDDWRVTAAVAACGMLLRDSPYRGGAGRCPRPQRLDHLARRRGSPYNRAGRQDLMKAYHGPRKVPEG